MGSRIVKSLSGAAIKSIQPVSIVIGSGQASNTATIAGVNTANTIVLLQGMSATVSDSRNSARLQLTNATTVTATRGLSAANSVTVKGLVIEFHPGFVKSVQAGTILMSSTTSNTATITSVDTAKSFVLDLGRTVDLNTLNALMSHLVLTNATTVTASRGDNGGANNTNFMVVELYQ